MNGFGIRFEPPEPPTPEQRAELEKQRLARMNVVERKQHAALPHLKEAQRQLREAAALGIGGSLFEGARQNMAVLIDDIETSLVRPPQCP